MSSSRVSRTLEYYGIYAEVDPANRSEWLYLCPFHDDHDIGSAKFNELKEAFYCFSCGNGGGLVEFVARLEGCTFKEAGLLLDNDFRDPRTFDLELTQRLVQRKTIQGITSSDYQSFAEAAVLRMLRSALTQRSEQAFYLASVLGSWTSSLKTKDLDTKQHQALSLYEEFHQQLSHERIQHGVVSESP